MSVNKYNSTTGNLERLDGYTVDSTPTSGSGNPVSSGGVFTALAGKADFDISTMGSKNITLASGISASQHDTNNAIFDGHIACMNFSLNEISGLNIGTSNPQIIGTLHSDIPVPLQNTYFYGIELIANKTYRFKVDTNKQITLMESSNIDPGNIIRATIWYMY